ncbi:hypothetical protein NQ314_002382 [Rhamnusium bicolor]|uniref:RDD domain-containing protein n=1 Tax=Rhamnusium bicolor TaxID=1586634 RepID=A0AAV8ZT51_9CUCU|nr:hypothetical protein NQ314_002382 [Rhamnusium bicolor]
MYATLIQANMHNENTRLKFTNNATNRNIASPFYQTSNQSTPVPVQPMSIYEFVIPPFWKRIVAEVVDFLILFLIKMVLTFLLLEGITDIHFYEFGYFQKSMKSFKLGVPVAIELLTLELLQRLVVCAYEAYFLKGRLCATPGKLCMGLIVIAVGNISPILGRQSETIKVTGATALGWQKITIKSNFKKCIC